MGQLRVWYVAINILLVATRLFNNEHKLAVIVEDFRYTDADTKISLCLCPHIKIICRRFRILTAFTFRDIRTRIYEMFIYKHTETVEYLFKKNTNFMGK